jgi:hypothetical protein
MADSKRVLAADAVKATARFNLLAMNCVDLLSAEKNG